MRTATISREIRTAFGGALKRARNDLGLSRVRLAKEIGVVWQTVQSWETGRTFPDSLAILLRLEEILGVNCPKLLEDALAPFRRSPEKENA